MTRPFALLAAAVTVCAFASPAAASLTFNFDEAGNGSISVNGGGFVPLNGSLQPDPSNGGAPALTFLLPASVTPVTNGDLRIFEDAGQTILGDALRFTDSQGRITGGTADRIIFYSALGGGMPADTGFPANLGTGATDTTVENPNGTFTLTANGPNIYNGLSIEATPEPATLAVFGVLAAGAFGLRRRQKATA